MKILIDIVTNHMILVPLIAWAVCQFIKIIINWIKEKKFDLKKLISDGGMPSAHVATVASLATACGFIYGFDNALFAISAVLTVVILRDAVSVRFQTGVNARAIKKLEEKMNESLPEESKVDIGKIKLTGGHTPLQCAVGVGVGVIVAVLYILIASVPSLVY